MTEQFEKRSVVEQLVGEAAEGPARIELVADFEDIQCTVAVAAEPGSFAAALDPDSLYIDSGAVHHRSREVADDLVVHLGRRIDRTA